MTLDEMSRLKYGDIVALKNDNGLVFNRVLHNGIPGKFIEDTYFVIEPLNTDFSSIIKTSIRYYEIRQHILFVVTDKTSLKIMNLLYS